MPKTGKRPCRICQRWFYPDPRVGDRQRACGSAECQTARRQKTQSDWRAGNPGYAVAYRIDRRHSKERDAEPLRLPPPLSKLPWDLAKDEFSPKGADFIGVMGKVLLRAAKDQSIRHPTDSTAVPPNNPTPPRKTRSGLPHTETRAPQNAATGVSSTGPPPGTPPGPPPGAVPAAAGVPG